MHPEELVEPSSNFRLDVPLHNLLTQSPAPPPGLYPVGQPQVFPDPVSPQRPELLGPVDMAADPRRPRSEEHTSELQSPC